jgi:rhamnogalacturonyl hydrolase YesR
MHAPDLVVVVSRQPSTQPAPGSLAAELSRTAPANTGTIPAIELPAGPELGRRLIQAASEHREPSSARREIQRRLDRSPRQIAEQLAAVYGHELPDAVYIPAVALIGRLRLGAIEDVERIVAAFYAGERSSLAKPTGSHLSGHLVFGELFRLTGKPRYLELVRAAADLGFTEGGEMKESMPLHNEMSDSVFMGCPILAQAGALTGDRRYFDMCVRHFRFMRKLTLRADGLYRHSPLDEAAWGRGNGFPALGLALTLSDFPDSHPDRAELLAALRSHMEALLTHQDPTGAWHQVIDRPESYRELTATCMIGFAMLRGVRSGWLERSKFQPAIDRAWYAAKTRIAPDGSLVDVCTGTGKQKSLRDYYDRPAILGRDPRGGAMALLLATEMLR